VQVFNLHRNPEPAAILRRLKTCGHFGHLRPLQTPAATLNTLPPLLPEWVQVFNLHRNPEPAVKSRRLKTYGHFSHLRPL
jgi:hypothetical protein